MQIGLFEVVNDTVVPGEYTMTEPLFLQLKEKHPQDFLKILSYLFFMTCWDSRNIYLNVPEEDRAGQILSDLQLDISLEDSNLIKALELCERLYNSSLVNAMKACKEMLDKLATAMRDTVPVMGGKNSNIDDIEKIMTKLPGLMESYNKVRENLKQEQSRIRGGHKIALDQVQQLNRNGKHVN